MIEVFCGDTVKLSVLTNKKAEWISSNTSIATVSQKGILVRKKYDMQ